MCVILSRSGNLLSANIIDQAMRMISLGRGKSRGVDAASLTKRTDRPLLETVASLATRDAARRLSNMRMQNACPDSASKGEDAVIRGMHAVLWLSETVA